MRKFNTEYLIIPLGFLALIIAFSHPLHAYIDPGTGSYFVQIIVASIASFMLFFVKPAMEKIKGLFKKDAPKPEEPIKEDVQK